MLRPQAQFKWMFLAMALGACASFESQKSRSRYESHLWSHLHERTMVSQGRNLVNVRWTVLGPKYFEQREKLLGFEDDLIKASKQNGSQYLLLALQMKPGAMFAKSDVKVFWQHQELTLKREVASVIELRSLYPFAYPFHRVFLYEISPSGSGKLAVWTPWGTIEDEENP